MSQQIRPGKAKAARVVNTTVGPAKVIEQQTIAAGIERAETRRIQQHVTTQAMTTYRKSNTTIAYENRGKEFVEFCAHVYCRDAVVDTVTPDKLYRFLFYHAYRASKKSSGKRKAKPDDDDDNNQNDDDRFIHFDAAEYDHIWKNHQDFLNGKENVSKPDDPPNPVGPQTLTTYRSAVHHLWEIQKAEGRNTYSWEEISDSSVDALMKIVKARRQSSHDNNYNERLREAELPLTNIGKEDAIEQWLWQQGNGGSARCLPSLRNRFIFLTTFNSLVRGESMFKGRLCDLFTVELPTESRDSEHMKALCILITTGKTATIDNKQIARVTRHRNVQQCAFGAMAMYLFHRFECSDEMVGTSRYRYNNIRRQR